jgi:DNA replication protein DnaC
MSTSSTSSCPSSASTTRGSPRWLPKNSSPTSITSLADGAITAATAPLNGASTGALPGLKDLDQFNWAGLKPNRLRVQSLFRLQFIPDKQNIIFLGGVGLGKSHLAVALGYQACLQGHCVLFATAIDVINTLSAAQAAGRLKTELKKYTRPAVLILDELGFLPIDKAGADLLFQVISLRYEQGPLVITSNRAFKDWPEIFNNDSTLTSAILDRLLHHAETVIIEGKSFRMKDSLPTQ